MVHSLWCRVFHGGHWFVVLDKMGLKMCAACHHLVEGYNDEKTL